MRFLIILFPFLILVISCAPRVSKRTYVEIGIASYYGKEFKGRRTASGEIFDPEKLTAAHPRLPFNTYVKVTNLENGRSVIVRINDRGPFKNGRIIDVSQKAAEILGFKNRGICKVKIEVVSWP
ncbi:MAG: septal ring lytic transglycosylase RlpA family protein [Candidatus Hydrothermia bacterium]|jgi:rare lipoprotein A